MRNPKVLFLRITENCNAGCFMCDFAKNDDGHMLSKNEYDKLLSEIKGSSYKMIRMTGGEPLINPNISYFIEQAKKNGYLTSIITNGLLLNKKIDSLAQAGLDQITISIDGNTSELNDSSRGVNGIFDLSIKAIKKCKEKYPHIILRVNTVVSNRNINSLIEMNELFLSLNVDQWEIIPIKDDYNCYADDPDKYIKLYKEFTKYTLENNTPNLLGYSRYWGGRDEKEIIDLFYNNKHYVPKVGCNLVNNVSFYIPSDDLLLPCNCIPHRLNEVSEFVEGEIDKFSKASNMAKWLNKSGYKQCTGCSPINTYLAENPQCIDENIWSF